jgi:hypothetical protein
MKKGMGLAFLKKKEEIKHEESDYTSDEQSQDDVENDIKNLDQFKIGQSVMNVGLMNAV